MSVVAAQFGYAIGRAARILLQAAGTLLLVSIIVFTLVRLAPIDAAALLAGRGATAEDIERIRTQLGMDESLVVQYARWLGQVVKGNFGVSLYVGEDVLTMIAKSAGPTAFLVAGGLLLAAIVGVACGVISALRPRSRIDRAITGFSALGVAVPEFLLGILMVSVFSVYFGWLPAVSYTPLEEGVTEWLRHLVLPWLALAAAPAAEITRQTRSAMSDVLGSEHVLSARARGLPFWRILVGHVLRNTASVIITIISLWGGRLLGGAVLIEFVFAFPGFGLLTVEAVQRHDYPVLQGVVLCSAVTVLLLNGLADLLASWFNPKGRSES